MKTCHNFMSRFFFPQNKLFVFSGLQELILKTYLRSIYGKIWNTCLTSGYFHIVTMQKRTWRSSSSGKWTIFFFYCSQGTFHY